MSFTANGNHECFVKSVLPVFATWVLVLMYTSGCIANEAHGAGQSALAEVTDTGEGEPRFIIDSEFGRIAGVGVGMAERELRNTNWPYRTRTVLDEGDEYKLYDLQLASGAHLTCTLDFENTIARIDSTSSVVRDSQGMGVGSTLREMKLTYPLGRFIVGVAEGRYASFVNGSRVIFRFDTNDIDESCFDYRQACKIDEDIVVQVVSISRYIVE